MDIALFLLAQLARYFAWANKQLNARANLNYDLSAQYETAGDRDTAQAIRAARVAEKIGALVR